MGFDLAALKRAVERHGRVARVVIAEVHGSAPREVGTAMLVWDGGQDGTIGGGTLEYAAARAALRTEGLTRHALGPDLGQCCGGAVTLLTELYDSDRVAALETSDVILRGPGEMPLAVRRVLDAARARGEAPKSALVQGWMIEPVARAAHPVWVWGAGHVGRALVAVLAPLPDFSLHWVDTSSGRFPQTVPDGVTILTATDPARLMPHAPKNATHLIVTYSHEMDLALCHAALGHGFAFAGLIGSDTKWARFRKRLAALGHAPDQIARITCPMGDKRMGRHPQAIAIGVAADLLSQRTDGKDMEWATRSSLSAG